MFWFIVITTAVAEIGGHSILAFRLFGWMWIVSLGMSVICIASPFRRRILFPIVSWIPCFIYMALRTDFSDRADLQRLGIFLTPVMVGTAASCLHLRNPQAVHKAYYVLFVFSVAAYVLAVLRSGSRMGSTGWYIGPGACMTLTLIAVAACVDWAHGLRRACVAIGICWLVCVLTQARMPVLVIPFLFAVGPWGQSLARKVVYGACILLLGAVLFHTQQVQSNIFRKGSGSIEDVTSLDPAKLSTGGRLYAWPLYLEAAKQNLWLGVGGTGSVEFGNETFGGWSHPHNEYIRLLFDYGIIGAVLFFLPILQLLVRCYKRRRSGSADVQWIYTVGAGGILAMLLLAITGNVFMYVAWFGNLLFATVGAGMAAEAGERVRKMRQKTVATVKNSEFCSVPARL